MTQVSVLATQTSSSLGEANVAAIASFLVFVSITLVITFWASRRTRTSAQFFAAGGKISAAQNGFALAGDYMSAASFLGIAGMVSMSGFDGLIYSVGWLVGWPVITFLIAEPLRNLGKYTFADVVAYRLRQRPVRIAAAISTLTVVSFYLIAQMVGAGELIQLMFGIEYRWAIVLVGGVMLLYVLFGGMIATTWVQIIKACLLLLGATLLAILVLAEFGFSPLELFAAAQRKYPDAMSPGAQVANPLDAISLGIALMFGTAGLPHILMRFYTVPDASTARRSVAYATSLIGFFYLVTFILGFGASVLVGREGIAKFGAKGNMAAPLLAETLGGTPFLGFISAVAFATILAVVAGLTLAGASAYSHDIYVSVIKNGHATEEEQVKAAKIATVVFGVVAVALGILFKGQNVAFMVGLTFSIAASANFPALLLSVTWKRFSTWGAVTSIISGTFISIFMIVISKTVWVDVLHNAEPLIGLRNPCIVSMTAAFAIGMVVSLLTPDARAQALFEDEKLRVYLGVGAE